MLINIETSRGEAAFMAKDYLSHEYLQNDGTKHRFYWRGYDVNVLLKNDNGPAQILTMEFNDEMAALDAYQRISRKIKQWHKKQTHVKICDVGGCRKDGNTTFVPLSNQ